MTYLRPQSLWETKLEVKVPYRKYMKSLTQCLTSVSLKFPHDYKTHIPSTTPYHPFKTIRKHLSWQTIAKRPQNFLTFWLLLKILKCLRNSSFSSGHLLICSRFHFSCNRSWQAENCSNSPITFSAIKCPREHWRRKKNCHDW